VLFRSWLAILVVAGILVVHIALSENRRSEFVFIIVLAALGTLLDSTLTWFGLFVFEEPSLLPASVQGYLRFLCPLWLIAIWVAFATTIGTTRTLLRGKLWLTPILGAIAAPLTYYAGVRFGAVQFGWSSLISMLVLAVVWVLFYPLAVTLHRRIVAERF